MHPSPFTCQLKRRRDTDSLVGLSPLVSTMVETLIPHAHYRTGKWFLSLLRPIEKGIACMPVFSQSCALCDTLNAPHPLHAAVKIFSLSVEAIKCHQETMSTVCDVASNHTLAALGSPMGGLFQCYSPCHPKSSSPTSSIVMFFRDIVCQHPSLQAALQKWCDRNLVFTWYQMSTSHVIHFIRDILSETQRWIDQLLSDTVPAFLEIRWAQMLSRALGVTTQQTDMVLASTLLSADTRLPLAKLLHLYPSIVLPCYSPATESWSMNWGEARQCMRRLQSRTHQGYAFMMIPDSLPTKRHFALARLLHLQITKLGSSFPVSVMSKGPGGSCTLWVAHTAPLERRWLLISFLYYT